MVGFSEAEGGRLVRGLGVLDLVAAQYGVCRALLKWDGDAVSDDDDDDDDNYTFPIVVHESDDRFPSWATFGPGYPIPKYRTIILRGLNRLASTMPIGPIPMSICSFTCSPCVK